MFAKVVSRRGSGIQSGLGDLLDLPRKICSQFCLPSQTATYVHDLWIFPRLLIFKHARIDRCEITRQFIQLFTDFADRRRSEMQHGSLSFLVMLWRVGGADPARTLDANTQTASLEAGHLSVTKFGVWPQGAVPFCQIRGQKSGTESGGFFL